MNNQDRDPRIFFAAERTLLAWNRTSLALIAFGFLVERAGLLIRVLAPGSAKSFSLTLIFFAGLGLMLLGAFSALYSARQYAKLLRSLKPEQIPQDYSLRWGVLVNVVVAGLAAILVVALVLGH